MARSHSSARRHLPPHRRLALHLERVLRLWQPDPPKDSGGVHHCYPCLESCASSCYWCSQTTHNRPLKMLANLACDGHPRYRLQAFQMRVCCTGSLEMQAWVRCVRPLHRHSLPRSECVHSDRRGGRWSQSCEDALAHPPCMGS